MSEILLDHIAIAVDRIVDAQPVMRDVLGGVDAFGGSSAAYRFRQWRFGGGGRLEILEPAGTDGFLRRFLRERGPGVHHVTFLVPSLRDVCERAQRGGYDIVGYDDADPEWKQAFLHPKQALGIVVQLAESPSHREPRRRIPASAVTMVGLRMRARSIERARAQWEGVLGGRCATASRDEVVYRWPPSPLALTVGIDPSADEGAVAVQYASARRLDLPRGPHPVLGAVFSDEPPGAAREDAS